MQTKREAEARESEERRLAEEDLHRREEECRLSELRRIRELEYEAEQLRLQARLEEEDENRDPESLANRLRDFEGDEMTKGSKEQLRSQRLTKRIPVLLCVIQFRLKSAVISKRKKT